MVNVNDSNITATQPIQWVPGLQLFACIFYTIILLVGVSGNILVIIIVSKYRDMRNATNLLLTNLSVADLFFLLFCTPDGYQHLYGKDKHRLGNFMCMKISLEKKHPNRFFLFQVDSVHLFKMLQLFVQF